MDSRYALLKRGEFSHGLVEKFVQQKRIFFETLLEPGSLDADILLVSLVGEIDPRDDIKTRALVAEKEIHLWIGVD